MYTVDRIEQNIVILENRNTKEYIEININKIKENVKEGDIIELIDDKYIINKEKTKELNNNIKNRFNKLKNK